MPFWIPAAIGAGATLLGELTRDRSGSNMEGMRFQRPDFGAQRQSLYGQLGEQATRAGRSAGMAIGDDPGRMASIGRGISSDAMRAYSLGNAQISQQQNASKVAENEFNTRRAQYLDQYRQQQPGFLDSLAGGVGIASSLYPLMYPDEFIPKLGQQGGNPEGAPFRPPQYGNYQYGQGFRLFGGMNRPRRPGYPIDNRGLYNLGQY